MVRCVQYLHMHVCVCVEEGCQSEQVPNRTEALRTAWRGPSSSSHLFAPAPPTKKPEGGASQFSGYSHWIL